jgi:hypothetical protein
MAMTGRQWIGATLTTLVAVVGLGFAVGYATDPYGVWRDPTGRKLPIYFAERKAKFLMSKRYVPANFDALLIGPSSSSNWSPDGINGYKIYNESVLGANVTEEKRFVDQALKAGHLKLAICILFPTMTNNHGILDGLDTVTTSEAFASIHVLVHEAAALLGTTRISFGKSPDGPNGNAVMKGSQFFDLNALALPYFALDPVAVKDYQEMRRSLKNHGVTIVYVVPTLYQGCYNIGSNKEHFEEYLKDIRGLLPEGPMINFYDPEFAGFSSNQDNYIDCFHLNAQGASRMNELLAQTVPAAIAEAGASR